MSHFPQTSLPTRPGYGHSSLPRSSRNGRNACFRRWKRSAATVTAGRNACGRSCGVWSRTEYGGVFFSPESCFSFKENSSTTYKNQKQNHVHVIQYSQYSDQKQTSSHLESVEDGRMPTKSAPVLVLRTVAEISRWPSWRDFDVGKGIGG